MTRLQDSLDKNHQRGGLKCPFCGASGEFEVYRTDAAKVRGQIRRIRVCKSCGRKVGTIEVVENSDNDAKEK